jgi:hypothetical protein
VLPRSTKTWCHSQAELIDLCCQILELAAIRGRMGLWCAIDTAIIERGQKEGQARMSEPFGNTPYSPFFWTSA